MSDAVPPPRGAPLPQSTPPAPSAQMRQIAQQFEAMFLNEMMGPMFEGLDTDGLGGGGVGEEMFRPMLIDQYAKAISHSGGIGLADVIVRELTRMQTAQADAAPPPTTEAPHGSRG
ncbi:MAG TPA: rod-binding protein [Caulobacterales bacterium]|nr:rod-binding protein [Caulobacterales bacterium]